MVYRFLVAAGIMFGIFPFLAMATFRVVHPDTPFGLDYQTWALGLIPIVAGWLLFLAPGLMPVVGRRYFAWVGRMTGLNAFGESLRQLYLAIRARLARVPDGLRRLAALRQRAKLQPVAQAAAPSLLADGTLAAPGSPHLPATDASEHPAAQSAAPAAQSAPAERTPLVIVRLKTLLQQWRAQVAAVAANPEAHVDSAKTKLRSLRERVATVRADQAFSPADLNDYTLQAVGHLKAIAKLAAGSLKLGPDDQAFVALVLQSIPEPAMPGQEEPTPPGPLDYPEESRPDLIAAAGRLRISLTEEDFEKASTGDLERGLKVMLAVISVADHFRRRSQYDLNEDPLLQLPLQQTA